MPTSDEAGLRRLLEGLDDETLADLEWLASRAEEESAEGMWSHVHEAKASPGIERVRSAHFRAMDELTSSLASGEIDLDEFKRRVHDAIGDSFRDAYSAGRGTAELDDADEEWLRRATEAEVGYAHKFGEEIEAGDVSDDRRLQRVGMYADTVGGIDYSGQVESLPDDARIRWVLGNAEHCEDCLLLACLLSDSMLIDTRRGRVPFREVVVGDDVVTHRGRMRRVTAKTSRVSAGKRPAVLVTMDGLFGVTDDHDLWTSRGWMPAREVCLEKERCLPGLRDRDRHESGEVQVVRREVTRRTQKGGGSSDEGFLLPEEEESLGGERVGGREEEDGLAPSVGLGDGERACPVRHGSPSRQWGLVRRQAGESPAQGTGPAFPGPQFRPDLSCMEGRGGDGRVRSMREGDEVPQIAPEEILFLQMRGGCAGHAGRSSSDMLSVRDGVHKEALPGRGEGARARVLLSEMLSRLEVGGGSEPDYAVRLLREEFQAGRVSDQELEVGQVLLLPGVLPPDTPLHDLTVEGDESFVAGGLAVHNSNSPYTKWELPTTPRAGGTQCKSNCRCKLVFTRGKLTKGEAADAVEFGYRRDASLTELLAGPEPPKGLRGPTAAERKYLDGLWNEVNYQRRLIASGGLGDDAMAEALAARKAANQEIIDFLQKEKVWDAPLWDVDEVIDGRHLGRRAESDIFRSGIDGLSLSKVDEEWLGSLVDRYERTIGEDFGEAADGREPGPAVVAGGGDEFCVVADSAENTARMLGWALLEARGREVQVGPLRTDLASRIYVWLKGRDAEATARALTRRVAARGGGAVAVPFASAARERR